MEISLKSNFDLGLQNIVLDGQGTLRTLLVEMTSRVLGNLTFIDPKTNELDDFFVISVNGQELPFLPHKLDTQLRDGDEVQIAVISFGGGSGEIL